RQTHARPRAGRLPLAHPGRAGAGPLCPVAVGVSRAARFAAGALLLHKKPTRPPPVGAPAAGAKGGWMGRGFVSAPFAPTAVLLQKPRSLRFCCCTSALERPGAKAA